LALEQCWMFCHHLYAASVLPSAIIVVSNVE
jgi:hypothetical protein